MSEYDWSGILEILLNSNSGVKQRSRTEQKTRQFRECERHKKSGGGMGVREGILPSLSSHKLKGRTRRFPIWRGLWKRGNSVRTYQTQIHQQPSRSSAALEQLLRPNRFVSLLSLPRSSCLWHWQLLLFPSLRRLALPFPLHSHSLDVAAN